MREQAELIAALDRRIKALEQLESLSSVKLVLDQGTGDAKILSIRSSDFTDHTDQGMDDDEYFYIGKVSGDDAGANLTGAGDGLYGIFIRGSCATGSSTDYAPLIFRGSKDNGSVSSTDNVMIVQNYSTTIHKIRGDGDLYVDGTYETFDYLESDVDMVRAESLLSPNAIRTKFDDFVRYNRDDLEAAGLVDGTFVNTTGMMRLHSGALWQLHQRIAELEAQLNDAGTETALT